MPLGKAFLWPSPMPGGFVLTALSNTSDGNSDSALRAWHRSWTDYGQRGSYKLPRRVSTDKRASVEWPTPGWSSNSETTGNLQTFVLAYAAGRISSKLNGRTSKFGLVASPSQPLLVLVGLSQQFRHECRIIALTVTQNCRNSGTSACRSFSSSSPYFNCRGILHPLSYLQIRGILLHAEIIKVGVFPAGFRLETRR